MSAYGEWPAASNKLALFDRGDEPGLIAAALLSASDCTYSHKYGRIIHVRTTVDIPDPLYRELKGKAANEGRSVKEVILRGVEQESEKPTEPNRAE